MLWWCYSDVTGVLKGYYRGVTWVLKDITKVQQGVAGVLQECYKGVTGVLYKRYRACSRSVKEVRQGCVCGVLYQNCLFTLPVLSWYLYQYFPNTFLVLSYFFPSTFLVVFR